MLPPETATRTTVCHECPHLGTPSHLTPDPVAIERDDHPLQERLRNPAQRSCCHQPGVPAQVLAHRLGVGLDAGHHSTDDNGTYGNSGQRQRREFPQGDPSVATRRSRGPVVAPEHHGSS